MFGAEIKRRKKMGQKQKGTEGQTSNFGVMGLYHIMCDIAELYGLVIKSIRTSIRLAEFIPGLPLLTPAKLDIYPPLHNSLASYINQG